MATFSPSAAVQLAINAARQAGLLDAPVRFAHALDDNGTPLQIYLANGRVILWPPADTAETTADSPAPPTEVCPPPDGDPTVTRSPTPPLPPSPKRGKK